MREGKKSLFIKVVHQISYLTAKSLVKLIIFALSFVVNDEFPNSNI